MAKRIDTKEIDRKEYIKALKKALSDDYFREERNNDKTISVKLYSIPSRHIL